MQLLLIYFSLYTCDVNILRPGVRYLSTLFLITTSNAAAQVRIFPATDNRESKLPTTLIHRKLILFDQYVYIIWRTLTSVVCLRFIILSVSSYQRGISIIVMIVAALSITVSLVVKLYNKHFRYTSFIYRCYYLRIFIVYFNLLSLFSRQYAVLYN